MGKFSHTLQFASEASVEHHSWPSFAQWIWCCLDKSEQKTAAKSRKHMENY